MTRADLETDGPPIRVSALAKILGASAKKVIADADRGVVRLVHVRCGQMHHRYVHRAEALRYLRNIGYRWPDEFAARPYERST